MPSPASFLGTLFKGFIGPDAVDIVKMPFGLDLAVGDTYGAGTGCHGRWCENASGSAVAKLSGRMYPAGHCALHCHGAGLGLSGQGKRWPTLVMVAINSLTMLVLYGLLGGFLLGVGQLPVPWQALLLSVGVYVALPLGRRIYFSQMDDCGQRRSMVQGKVPARSDAGYNHRTVDNAGIAVLIQGRDHSSEPVDDFVDSHSAFHPDRSDILRWDMGCPRRWG